MMLERRYVTVKHEEKGEHHRTSFGRCHIPVTITSFGSPSSFCFPGLSFDTGGL
jgi:hypothetical protein